MSQFSISYSGVESVVSGLVKEARVIDGIAVNFHSAAMYASENPSISKKGYGSKINNNLKVPCDGIEAELRRLAELLKTIETAYSSGESKVIGILDTEVSSGIGYSEGSVAAASEAAAAYKIHKSGIRTEETQAGRTFDDISEMQSYVEKLNEKGISKWIKRIPVIKDYYEQFALQTPDIMYGVTHPTNLEALGRAGKAVVSAIGFGYLFDVGDMAQQYAEDSAEAFAKGNIGKGAVLAVGGVVNTTGKFLLKSTEFALKTIYPGWKTASKVNGVLKINETLGERITNNIYDLANTV